MESDLGMRNTFQGKYNRIRDVNRHLYRWIEQNGYRISGKALNVYYLSPGNEQNPDNFVTEICYPIQK
jgi:effector-binding domain-containing protein